jgi:hypothetical protein
LAPNGFLNYRFSFLQSLARHSFLVLNSFLCVDRFSHDISFIMHGLTTSAFAYLLFALFTSQIRAFVLEDGHAEILLEKRQPQVSCDQYASIANLSIVAMNSTFRADFVQASRDGTLQSSAILDNALNQFMSEALMNDTTLNQQCGNLTLVAVNEAPKNFSEGIILDEHVGAAAALGGGVRLTAVITAAMVGAAVLSL